MKAQDTIKWKTQVVNINKIKATPNNFKLKTESGLAMFRTSVKNYGRAGVVILNLDYTLIDGNTRWEAAKEAGDKTIEASLPNRMLTKKEFTEFAAMFDMARASDVDIKRIHDELGTTASFFKKWGMEIPMNAEKKLQELEASQNIITGTKAKQKEESKESTLLEFCSRVGNDSKINCSEVFGCQVEPVGLYIFEFGRGGGGVLTGGIKGTSIQGPIRLSKSRLPDVMPVLII